MPTPRATASQRQTTKAAPLRPPQLRQAGRSSQRLRRAGYRAVAARARAAAWPRAHPEPHPGGHRRARPRAHAGRRRQGVVRFSVRNEGTRGSGDGPLVLPTRRRMEWDTWSAWIAEPETSWMLVSTCFTGRSILRAISGKELTLLE